MATGVVGGTGGTFPTTVNNGDVQSAQRFADYNATLNGLYKQQRKDCNFYDDLTGSTFTHAWTASNAAQAADSTELGDAAAGAAVLSATSGGNASIRFLTNTIGTADLYMSARVRYLVSNTSGTFQFGLQSGDSLHLRSTDAGNWILRYGVGSTATVDTGVAPSSSYQLLEIERISGILTARIDGTQVASVSFPDSLPALFFDLQANRTSADCTLVVDFARLWFER